MPPPLLHILTIESSGESGGAAIVTSAGRILSEVPTEGDRTHGALLVPCIDRAVEAAGISREMLGGIAVNCGPGSYTGLRVGVAAAEAISLVLGIPVLGVPCFEVMCEELLRAGGFCAGDAGDAGVVLIPALDARQGACSAAAFSYQPRADVLTRLCPDSLVPPEEIQSLAAGVTGGGGGHTDTVLFGQAADAYAGRYPGSVTVKSGRLDIRPATVGMAALRLWPEIGAALESARGRRVEIRYFRPIMAKTIAERQSQSAS